ncbi:hypothetical protein PtA15_8A140 [Puccinia triticina]|uniref:Uncharacterized protein n=1 Tax=Puccinia triticina TaxID=208348 RepID=A0ABY7CSB4_9BASI|nr:uncharacterized protein PtA15_8A140 [Puccinia triticina]WAQ87238.1 hypothetical protein PtA15_8A140 [Puccinia triticina]
MQVPEHSAGGFGPLERSNPAAYRNEHPIHPLRREERLQLELTEAPASPAFPSHQDHSIDIRSGQETSSIVQGVDESDNAFYDRLAYHHAPQLKNQASTDLTVSEGRTQTHAIAIPARTSVQTQSRGVSVNTCRWLIAGGVTLGIVVIVVLAFLWDHFVGGSDDGGTAVVYSGGSSGYRGRGKIG